MLACSWKRHLCTIHNHKLNAYAWFCNDFQLTYSLILIGTLIQIISAISCLIRRKLTYSSHYSYLIHRIRFIESDEANSFMLFMAVCLTSLNVLYCAVEPEWNGTYKNDAEMMRKNEKFCSFKPWREHIEWLICAVCCKGMLSHLVKSVNANICS